MNTDTTNEQTIAARALLALVTAHGDLPAAQLELPQFVDFADPLTWGVRVIVHDNLSDFEQWRHRLGLDPAEVDQRQGRASGWLIVKGTHAGAPIELVGFYDLDDAEGER